MTARRAYRKNCGPQLTERVRNLTSELHAECMEQARAEVLWTDEIAVSDLALEDHIRALKQRSHEIYQQRIRTLSTKDLEDILWVHECGSYKRMPETLENITSELAKRQLFE